MKKVAILFLFNLLNCLLIGQSSTSFPAIGKLDTLYYFDFDGGLPNGWTLSGSQSNALWEYRGPNTTPSNTVGSRGAYNGNRGPINSPTWHNGFMIFDSDYLDNGGVTGASGTGPAPLPHFGSIISDTLDFSSSHDVGISFQSYMRNWASGGFLLISTDGGSSFADTIAIHGEWKVNQETSNPQIINLNLSQDLGGKLNVVIKLLFDGRNPFGFNTLSPGYYFWQLDDILFFEIPNNDLVLEKLEVKQGSKKGIYGIIPKSQTDSISFKATINNSGKEIQTNTTILTKTSSLLSGTDSNNTYYGSLSPSQRDSIALSPSYLPVDTGNYISEITVYSDSTDLLTHNNTASYSFRVSDSVFALDHGFISSHIGTYSFTGGYDDFQVLNLFEATDSLPIKYVWAKLDSTSKPGVSIYVVAYDSTGATFGGGNEFVNQANPNYKSQKYVITHADSIRGYLIIPVEFNLKGGMYVGLEMNSQLGKFPIGIAVDESTKQHAEASLIYILNTGLYTNPNAAQIRLGSNKKELIGNDPCEHVAITIEGTVDNTISSPSNGSVKIDTVFGGTPPYYYLWYGPGDFYSIQKDIFGLLTQGDYTLTVSDSNGCSSTIAFEYSPTTVFENSFTNNILISPNPSNGQISLFSETNTKTPCNLEITAINGSVLYRSTFTLSQGKSTPIYLENLSPGIYFLTLKNEGDSFTEKIVIQ